MPPTAQPTAEATRTGPAPRQAGRRRSIPTIHATLPAGFRSCRWRAPAPLPWSAFPARCWTPRSKPMMGANLADRYPGHGRPPRSHVAQRQYGRLSEDGRSIVIPLVARPLAQARGARCSNQSTGLICPRFARSHLTLADRYPGEGRPPCADVAQCQYRGFPENGGSLISIVMAHTWAIQGNQCRCL